jgi:acyl-CoA synthetase (AMP-forming)/AMP-acid ligase II
MRVMRSNVTSLIDLVVEQSAKRGGDRAYTFLESGERDSARLTWSEVHRRSSIVAAGIQARVPRGSRVLLLFPPGLDFVTAFFGSLYAGAIAVPAHPTSGTRADAAATRLRGMIADAGVTLIVTVSAIAAKARALGVLVPELQSCEWLEVDRIPDAAADAWRRPQVDRDDVAFLQYTSGSTTTPRGVMVSHGNLLHNLAYCARLGRFDESSVSVSWLPVSHDMGLIQGVLQPAFCGCSAWLMAPAAFLQRPARWLRAISRLRATHSGAPNFAYDLSVRRISDADLPSLDLNSWRVAFNGSEPVRQQTLESFHRRFATCGFQWDAFRPAYGLAESTLLVAATAARTGPVFASVDEEAFRGGAILERPRLAGMERHFGSVTLVACGPAEDGVRVEIVHPVDRTRVAPNQVGEIWVSSPSVAMGYWQRPEETTATFSARLATGEGPFLRTGDVGFVRDGRLFVAGRLKDLLIVRGLKHYPQDIELTVERANTSLRPGCSAVFAVDADDDRIAAVAEIDPRRRSRSEAPSLGSIIEDIRIGVAERHGIQLSAVVILPVGALPKTTSGKLRRYACREALLSDTLPALALWAEDDLSFRARNERIAS